MESTAVAAGNCKTGSSMLELKNIQKSFVEPNGHRLPVLNIEQFAVAAGEQVAMVGKSGCGKTTLLHVIAGISTPDSGQVIVCGHQVNKLSEAARDRFRADHISYVFQTFNLMPGF